MLSLLHVATAPVAFKLSSPSHQLSPYSPLVKRTTFTAVLADASNSADGDHSPAVAICPLKGINPLITDTQRLPACDIGSGARDHSIANSDTTPNPTTSHSSLAPPTYPCSSFPVRGPFDLVYCVQRGGYGTAWAARDRSTGRLLCLKVFQPLQDPNTKRSVRSELRVFRRMVKSERGERGKQFIMELNRSFQHGNEVFFAMELMATDLGSYLSIEPERCKLLARRWMAQIALGIASLHEMGIIHRDIKSENILIDSRENIRIIDFGLSFILPTGKALDEHPPSEFLGTLPYIAPEVLRNKGVPNHQRKPYGMAVDWWALGCILFELESRDHQLLFDSEEDVVAYIAWTRQFRQVYPRFKGFDPIVMDLLQGFLQVQPLVRYSLDVIEDHDYFLRRDGTSEFDNAAARALERPVRPELVPHSTGDEPFKVIEAAKLASIYDWTNIKWAQVDG